MTEISFFESDKVIVTNQRIIFPSIPTYWQRILGGTTTSSTTYIVQGITSVKQDIESPSRILAYLFMLIGLLSIPTGVGIFIILICLLWLHYMKNIYTISLNLSSRETKIFSSDNEEFVNNVTNAINNAIIYDKE